MLGSKDVLPSDSPEILAIFTMLGEKPGVVSRDLASNGRNPAAAKNCDETFVETISAQASGSDFIK